jgi:DNA-binding response OmpR family regulator
VDTAQTATEAMELLAGRRYAAIVADCVLPDLPPLDWLAALRGAAPGMPLVVYSGPVVLDDLPHLARDWGVAAVLEKRSRRPSSWRRFEARSRTHPTGDGAGDDGPAGRRAVGGHSAVG